MGLLDLALTMQSTQLKETLKLTGTVIVKTYRAGMVEKLRRHIDQFQFLRTLPKSAETDLEIQQIGRDIQRVQDDHFIATACETRNLIMDSAGCGIDLIIQRLVGINTYSLNILFGEIGTGSTAPALTDSGLQTPTNRAAVGFQQDYGSTDAVFQFFFADSQLANETYNEFGTFVDGTSTIGSGQIFNRAPISYEKVTGQDTTVQVDFALANS
jgi:hypothetical protein